MTGLVQWANSFVHFNIHRAIMRMLQFSVMLREGNSDQLNHIYGYLKKFQHVAIQFRTEEPDYSILPNQLHYWKYTIYGNVKEIIPSDLPKPLGNRVTLAHFVDANLCCKH